MKGVGRAKASPQRVPGFSWDSRSELKFSRLSPGHRQLGDQW